MILCDLIIALEERNIYSQFEYQFYSSIGAIFFSKLRDAAPMGLLKT